jgi:hypothetical protein
MQSCEREPSKVVRKPVAPYGLLLNSDTTFASWECVRDM